jgi:hypothetical protein
MDALIEPSDPRRANSDERRQLCAIYGNLFAAGPRAEGESNPVASEPVPILKLRDEEVEDSTLLWLLYQGHFEHLKPVGRTAKRTKGFKVIASLRFDDESAFALTDAGRKFVETFSRGKDIDRRAFKQTSKAFPFGRLVPRYDTKNRVFSWGVHIIKRFRQPSDCQELLLKAAEELGWPATWMDDPLPPLDQLDSRIRLLNTIKNLNRNQRASLLHFIGDGTGTRFGYELR